MLRTKWQGLAKRYILLALALCCLCTPWLQSVASAEPKPPMQWIEIHRLSKEYRTGYALEQEKNFKEARKAYELGTKKSDPLCIYRLGVFNVEGIGGLPKDNSRGIKLIKQAARLGEQDACYWLGRVYLNGWYGLKKDPEKGDELIRKAAKLGHVEAIDRLAVRE